MTSHDFDEEKFCEWDDYRAMFVMPIFAGGIAKFAGHVVTPDQQAASGMKAIIKFWCDNDMPKCGEPDMADAAVEIAIWTASLLFEEDTVEAAWGSIKSWVATYCKEKQPPKRLAKITPKRVMKRRGR